MAGDVSTPERVVWDVERDRPCPTCAAPAGEPCFDRRSARYYTQKPHRARRDYHAHVHGTLDGFVRTYPVEFAAWAKANAEMLKELI